MTPPEAPGRALLVGAGLVTHHLRLHLEADGWQVVCAHRQARPAFALDVTADDAGRRLRRMIDELQPRVMVLAHGPSDPAWCDDHRDTAIRAHAVPAEAAAASSARVVVVSSDAVFAGDRPTYPTVDQPVDPRTAYGKAKAEAEAAVAAAREAVVVRSSVVYGTVDGRPMGFVGDCILRLHRGAPVEAPQDQVCTPVAADDLGAHLLVAATCRGVPRIVHVAGPDAASRYGIAVLAAHELGVNSNQVVAVPRSGGRWASRPAYSLLCPTPLPGVEPTRPLRQGLRDLVRGHRQVPHVA